jgi:5-hydroxyisourate hydrolase
LYDLDSYSSNVRERTVSGKLTTHVLDTASGRPAAGVRVTLTRLDAAGGPQRIGEYVTNADGRCDGPLLAGEQFVPGRYELCFAAGEYFRAQAATAALAEPRFIDEVVLRFGLAEREQHYHVPLLVSPWSYSTYRGS